jgi:predicted alpha-1,2-mannosidase
MLTRRDVLRNACAAGFVLAAERRGLLAQDGAVAADGDGPLARFIDPFLGTGGHGHTFPGAAVPYGMVQLSPDSGKQGWDWCAGYHYSDTTIAGFTHTHLSGTGIGDLCDILVMPTLAGPGLPADVQSPFSHDKEKASAGYYSVDLLGTGVKVELTVTRRVGLHRYYFPRMAVSKQPAVVVDLGHAVNWDQPTDTQLTIEGPTTLIGYRRSTGWAKDQIVYFVIRFSKPIITFDLGNERESTSESRQVQDKKVKGVFRFTLRPGEPLLVKVGISCASIDGARKNLERELAGWEFDEIRKAASAAWERKLQRAVVQSKDSARKTIFYTALYHSMLAPTLFCDVDGTYRGADGKVHPTSAFLNHTVFSLWDTFRALHPLLTIIQPDKVDDLVQSMMAFSREGGLLPVWSLWGNETNTMIGYHAVPVIVDAIFKGLTTVNRNEALEAMKKSATQDARGLKFLTGPDTRGYIPSDAENESVSKTLEYAFDDWCIARLAGKLDRVVDQRQFFARAGFYRNVFDTSTGFMRGRLADGSWRTPFSPLLSDHTRSDFTEGNAWQHSWFAPHDVGGLIGLMGGPEAFVKKLDELFDQKTQVEGANASPDISGLIGQYAHGNEPSHHIAYLYGYAGAPWKTAERVRQITGTLYRTGPEGLCGNEDCGQMSAWYILSAMGFYPVNPAEGVYVIGTPHFEKMTLDLGGGRTLSIDAPGVSDANSYVQGVTLNGKPLERAWIAHGDIAAGGSLRFTMGAEPNRTWATSPESAPPSMSKL